MSCPCAFLVRHADVYRVQLSPAGRRAQDALPQTEEQLQAAVHGILHGLHSLHEVRFVKESVYVLVGGV